MRVCGGASRSEAIGQERGAVDASQAVPLLSLPVSRPSGCWWFPPSSPLASFGSYPTASLLERLFSCAIASLFERLFSCAIASLFERLPFPTARPWAGCASGLGSWLLPLALPPLGYRLLLFGWGVAGSGSWSPVGCSGWCCSKIGRSLFGSVPSVFC